MAKLLDFVRQNGIERLKKPPYNFKLTRDPTHSKLVTVNYDQRMTQDDGSDPVIRQARGTTLDLTDPQDPKLVRYPFDRFYNYGQDQADSIDWESARVQEKLDGMIVIVCRHPKTTKMVAGSRSCLVLEEQYQKSLQKALKRYNLDLNQLDPDHTHIFELIGPEVQIVVEYLEEDLRHLGSRCMTTLREVNLDLGIPGPKEFNLDQRNEDLLDSVKSSVQDLNGRESEGRVVVDRFWRRVKIKAPDYLEIHDSAGPQVPLKVQWMILVLNKEHEEHAVSRPQLAPILKRYADGLQKVIDQWNQNHRNLTKDASSIKEFGQALGKKKAKKEKKCPVLGLYSKYHFSLYKGQIASFEAEIRKISDTKRVQQLVDLVERLN